MKKKMKKQIRQAETWGPFAECGRGIWTSEALAKIAENINVFDFTLSEEEMSQIKTLETGRTEIINHYDWHAAKMLNTIGRCKGILRSDGEKSL